MLKIKEFLATHPISWRHLAISLGILLTGPITFHLVFACAQLLELGFNYYILGIGVWGAALMLLTIETTDAPYLSENEHTFFTCVMGTALGLVIACMEIFLLSYMTLDDLLPLLKVGKAVIWGLCLGLSIAFYKQYPLKKN